MKRWIIGFVGLATVTANAVEMGSLRAGGELKDKPFMDAAKVADLAASAPLEIVARQGAWMQVKTKDGQIGWVKMLSVRTGSGDAPSGSGSGLLALASAMKTGSTSATASTGVKGIDEVAVRNAAPNPAQLAKLGTFAVKADDAGKFARDGKLVAQPDLAYLSQPSNKR